MAEQKSLPAMLSASAAAGGADWGVLQLGSHVAHWGLQGQAGYDHEGNALAYSYSVLNQQTHAWTATGYTVSYLKQDGYLEASTAGTSTNTSLLPTADTSLYDAFGRRIAIDSHAQGQTTDGVRAFAYDANGQILERRDGTATNGSTFTPTGTYATQHYAYVDGQQMGEVDEGGGIDVLSGVTGFSDSSQGTRSYVVQQGDTLDGIAQQVYGDASLWYVVADANGLASNSDLVMGQTLKLPQVTTDSNTAETFKPYDPNAIQGSTTPSLPHAPQPPPSAHHCNALAAIVVIAVAVVVSWATYGALAPEMDSWAGSVLAGAAAGAAGSAASQVAGDALGTQKGFDWGQVLVGAVGGAIGGGVAAKLSSEGSDFSVLADGSDNLEPLGNAIVGASSYVGSYEADKLVGEPAHFSWAGLVAETVGAAVAGKLGPTKEEQQAGITGETWGKTVAANAVQDVVQREVSVGLGDDHVQSWQQIAEDVFGNALGNAAVGAINEAEWKAAQPRIDKQAGSIVGSIIGDNESSAGTVLPAGYGESWENGTLFSNAGLSGVAGLTDGSSAGSNYSIIPTSESPKGYPVPVNYTNDPAVIKALYANTVAYVNYENQQPLNYLPSVPGPDDPQALIDYNHELQHGLYPQDYLQTLDTVNVVGTRQSTNVAPPYWVSKGYFANTYDTAVEGMSDSSNTPFQRVVFGALATAEAPLMLVEETARGVVNAPAQAAIAYQAFRAASTTSDSYQRWSDIAQGLGASGQAILGAIPVAGTVEGAIARSMLRTDAAVVVPDVASISTVDAAPITPTAADYAAPFQPQGLAANPLSFPDGVKLVRAFEAQGFGTDEAVRQASRLIGTGSTLPVATPLDTTDVLFKFVPKGAGVSPNTAFFTTGEQAAFYSANPEMIGDAFGLPLQSQAGEYDLYMVRPNGGAVVYESTVAPTVQGTWQQDGQAIQRLIIDRNQFTPPVKVDTVQVPGW